VVLGTELLHRFDVENRRARAIEIRGVMAVHGCWATGARIGAGEKGTLDVRCPTIGSGSRTLRVPLVVEPSESRPPELELSANITPRLGFDKQLVELETAFGAPRSEQAGLIGALAEKVELRLLAPPDGSLLNVRILPRGPHPARVKVTCKAKRVGVYTGNLMFQTQPPEAGELVLPYSCKVLGTLSVSPTNPYINLRLGGQKFVDLEVKSSAPGFALNAAEVSDGPFTARVEAATEPGVFRVRVSVVEARLPDETRAATGTLRLVSNDRAEPHKEIPLFAFGRLNR
jgi:hypothetical protein